MVFPRRFSSFSQMTGAWWCYWSKRHLKSLLYWEFVDFGRLFSLYYNHCSIFFK